MKKLLLFITAIFICGVSIAQTIRWHIGDTVYQTTTCNAGESITPPSAPEKFGYTFQEWEAGYTPIEYLESTGTQWIDTGYIPTIKTAIETDYQYIYNPNVNPDSQFGAGNDADSSRFRFSGNPKTGTMGCSLGSYIPLPDISSLDRHILKINAVNQTCSVDDYTIQQTRDTFIGCGTRTFFLFNLNNGTNIYKHYARVFYLKIWDNDVLVRDFIPVLDKNGTPCMYDKVEKKYYYNAGTGQFIAGPVIGE